MELPWNELKALAERECARDQARPLFVTVSGAHLYGFASPDSDFDVRGAHLMPLDRVIGLKPARETLEYSGVENGREMDFVSHDAGKFFRLMLRKNGYVMEQVFSPLVVLGGPDLDELREIARGCITRHIHHHYRGFSENEADRLDNEPEKRIKTLLYVYRVFLTGIHVLRTGEIESNLGRLLELYPQETPVRDLIAAKVREKATLTEAELAPHRKGIESLRRRLEDACLASTLPEEPARADDLDAFLVRLRRRSG